MEKFLDTEVKYYSSGMFLRLAFSVAVHTEPDVFLVDEILAVGDPPFRRKCIERVQQLSPRAAPSSSSATTSRRAPGVHRGVLLARAQGRGRPSRRRGDRWRPALTQAQGPRRRPLVRAGGAPERGGGGDVPAQRSQPPTRPASAARPTRRPRASRSATGAVVNTKPPVEPRTRSARLAQPLGRRVRRLQRASPRSTR
jgi:hypothetical protein